MGSSAHLSFILARKVSADFKHFEAAHNHSLVCTDETCLTDAMNNATFQSGERIWLLIPTDHGPGFLTFKEEAFKCRIIVGKDQSECPEGWGFTRKSQSVGRNGDVFSVILPNSQNQITIVIGRELSNHLLSDHLPSDLTLWFASTVISAKPSKFQLGGSEIIIISIAALIIISFCLVVYRIFMKRRREQDKNGLVRQDAGYHDTLPDGGLAFHQAQRSEGFGFKGRELPLKEGKLGSLELADMQDTGNSLPRQLLTDELPFK
jgi:hypothetical protein